MNKLLNLELAFLGRLDSLVVGVHYLLQLAPQIFPILQKGLDLVLPLLFRLLQPLHFLTQPGDHKAVFL